MADQELTALSAVTTVGDSYLAYVVDGPSGDSKKITLANLLAVSRVAGIDPTGSADAASAINSALSATHSAGGGIVQLPPGTFKIGTGLTMFDDVILQGVGMDSTILKASANITMITLSQTAVPETPCYGFGIRDLTIDGNSTAATGVKISLFYRWRLDNLRIRRCNTYGLYLLGAPVGDCYNVNLTECVIGCYAEHVTNGTSNVQSNLINWFGGRHEQNTGWCFDVNHAAGWNCYGTNFELSGTHANDSTGVMRFTDMCPSGEGFGVSLHDVWGERNAGYAFLLLNAPAADNCLSMWKGGLSRFPEAGEALKYGIYVSGSGNINIMHTTTIMLDDHSVKDVYLSGGGAYWERGALTLANDVDTASGHLATYGSAFS